MTKSSEPEEDVELLARIDAELRSTLDLETSPRFGEGVWRRIEERRRRVHWRRGLAVPAVATLVAATLVITVAGGGGGVRPAVTAPAPEPRAAIASPPGPSPGPRPEAVRPAVARPKARPPSQASVEVLVPGEQQALLQRLIRQLDRMPVIVAPGPPAGPTLGIEIEPIRLERIAIEPIQVEP